MDTSYSTTTDAPRKTPQQLAETYGQYSGRTHEIPRPEAPDNPGKYFNPAALVNEQRQWDNAEAERQRLAAWVAENRAKEAADAKRRQDERDAARQAKTLADRTALEAELKERFMGQPGVDENDWERLKQQYIDDHLLRQAGVADEAARASYARRLRAEY